MYFIKDWRKMVKLFYLIEIIEEHPLWSLQVVEK